MTKRAKQQREPRGPYKMKFTPTKKQKELLEFLVAYIKKHGIAPTTLEIAEKRGVSYSAVVQMLQKLEQRGLISRIKSSPRAINITGMDHIIKPKEEEEFVSMLDS